VLAADSEVLPSRVIAIGASAGGLEALTLLLSALPKDVPATFVVAMHLAPSSPSVLARILSRAARFPFVEARDGEPLRPSHGYAAPPDRHVLVRAGRVYLWNGPRENYQRPAVDPLFRSAAAEYGARAVGVVLSGNLDDGSAGLRVLQNAGGMTAIQSPEDALFPGMPRFALASVRPDLVASAWTLGRWLDRVAREPAPRVPACPDCGRPFFELNGELVGCASPPGHLYPARTVFAGQDLVAVPSGRVRHFCAVRDNSPHRERPTKER
jgi:two-component system chemotaxis response regulator CheB